MECGPHVGMLPYQPYKKSQVVASISNTRDELPSKSKTSITMNTWKLEIVLVMTRAKACKMQ
jgi:hypothetical protein